MGKKNNKGHGSESLSRPGKTAGSGSHKGQSIMQLLNANADVLTTAKLRELSLRATDIQPRIIAVSQVKPRNFKRTRIDRGWISNWRLWTGVPGAWQWEGWEGDDCLFI